MKISGSHWLKLAKNLLAPVFSPCLFCGKAHMPSTKMPGLCTMCEAALPWIGIPRCRKCGRPVGCPDCSRSHEHGLLRYNRSAVSYSADMREVLGRYKYRGNERLGHVLGQMLDQAYAALQEVSIRNGDSTPGPPFARPILPFFPRPRAALWQADVLVPVPVSSTRLAERGFNQAEQLAAVLAGRRRIPLLPLLVRTQHTAKQSFKSRAERFADMKHAFAASTDPVLQGHFAALLQTSRDYGRPLRVVIVDDIYTTGSTLRACAGALVRQPGATLKDEVEICSITWARS
ncbi:ComF family protein ['Paenibacillus yunnanensis' Narsing Rao et al. 2020]|uniref:ComF family protein n=1 Tax=Paenibacillus tengchongensis TaxID=2608684 RepID=UPI00124E4765|nr:ComF family protein [Paenibacillus tengchongensis]